MVKRCLGALEEPPVVEALSFLDRTERDRFLLVGEIYSALSIK